MTFTPINKDELERLRAAESVCHTVLLMMGLGLLEIPQADRDMLGESMQVWADLAAAQGIIKEGE